MTFSSFFLILTILVGIPTESRADVSDLMVNTQSIPDTTASQGTSTATENQERAHFFQDFSITDSTMLMGPSINNLQGQMPAPSTASTGKKGKKRSAGGGKDSPYSLRHQLSFGYKVNEAMSVSPVLDLSQPLQGANSGKLKVNDPQLKMAFRNVLDTKLGLSSLKGGLQVALFAPVSDLSQRNHSWGAASVSFTPKLHFQDSRASLSGLGTVKTGVYGKETGPGTLVTNRIYAGIQENHQLARSVDCFLMEHYEVNTGPKIRSTDAGIPGETLATDRGFHPWGIMTGLKYQANPSLSITPRLNWNLDQPLSATSIGVNLFIKLM